jgi:nucleoside-specific outer membrane channel protein Tsx
MKELPFPLHQQNRRVGNSILSTVLPALSRLMWYVPVICRYRHKFGHWKEMLNMVKNVGRTFNIDNDDPVVFQICTNITVFSL